MLQSITFVTVSFDGKYIKKGQRRSRHYGEMQYAIKQSIYGNKWLSYSQL